MGSNRSKRSQSKHDRCVLEIAREERGQGHEVEADLSGWPNPPTIGGSIPDLLIEKSYGHTTIIEVETEESVGTKRDREQRAAFRRWADRKTTRHFKLVVAS